MANIIPLIPSKLARHYEFENHPDDSFSLSDRYIFSQKTLDFVDSINSLKKDLTAINSSFNKYHNYSPNLQISNNITSDKTLQLATKLYESATAAILRTSSVAMHLSPAFRTSLFKQIDLLHDVNTWDEDDSIMIPNSFDTFLRTIIHIKPDRNPSLALTQSGHLLAGWFNGHNTLSVEFFPYDKVRWVLARELDDSIDISSSESTVVKMPLLLSPYKPDIWFKNA